MLSLPIKITSKLFSGYNSLPEYLVATFLLSVGDKAQRRHMIANAKVGLEIDFWKNRKLYKEYADTAWLKSEHVQ